MTTLDPRGLEAARALPIGSERHEVITAYLAALSQPQAGEPVACESMTPGYRRFVTDEQYEGFSLAVRRWYKPYRCSNCCAPHPALAVEGLTWTQKAPPGRDHDPFRYWAAGIGGHYTVEPDGLLWMAHDKFIWEQFPNRDAAKAFAQVDHETRIRSQIVASPEALPKDTRRFKSLSKVDDDLGEPKREFADTFSAETVVMPSVASPPPLGEAQIKHMVGRFLNWKLPANFNPDGGISFKAEFNEHTAHPMKHEPSGTNLLDASQAEAMVRHMLDGLPQPVLSEKGLDDTGGAQLLPDGNIGCLDCGEPYGSPSFPDLVIDNDAFAAIAPNPPDGGILCPNCICARLAKAGLSNVTSKFTSGPLWVASPPTALAVREADIARASESLAGMIADWYGNAPLPNARITADVIALRLARFVSPPHSGEVEAPPCWWIDHGSHGQITQREDEASRAISEGKCVVRYIGTLSIAPATADGWRLMPVEPDEAMLKAGGRQVADIVGDPYASAHWMHFSAEALRIYRAMSSAAPTAGGR